MITYIALFSALLSRLDALTCGSAWVTSFIARFLDIHWSGVLTVLAWLVLHETAAVSAQVLCTPYNHAPCHFMQSHIRKVYVCLAVTCYLHFWQNDWDLLRATAVTLGWNRYQNKSQHRKSTLEKKILPPLQQGGRNQIIGMLIVFTSFFFCFFIHTSMQTTLLNRHMLQYITMLWKLCK